MKTIYTALIVAIMIGFSGCTGASTENPTIRLNGDRTITLAIGQSYEEKGATASDAKDGDLTNLIQISGVSPYYYKAGETYQINYSVQDSDGNRAEAIRTIYVVDQVANVNDQLGLVEYDLVDYLFNALVYTPTNESSKVVTQDMYYFNGVGEQMAKLTYEKSYNPTAGVSIHQYRYDNELKQDVSIERDIITELEIEIVNYKNGSNTSNSIKRKVRINEAITYNGSAMTCTLREHYPLLDTRNIPYVQDAPINLHSNYGDVLRVQCIGPNNYIADTYIKNGLGEVASVSSSNGTIAYSILDQNSWHVVN